MDLIEDESVHLVITSPPYWQLKDYDSTDQIGYNDSYETYINNLNLVWSQCHRVLHKGCRMCINIGDQFARSVYYGRYKVIPIRTEIIKFCESIGFDYMGAIIWQKKTTTNTTGGASLMGSYPTPRNGIISIDYEFILIFKKLGDAPKPTAEMKEQSKLSKDEWKEYFSGHWNFAGARQDGHIAMFPEELPARLIKMFAFAGETVLDPFMGSGTTALAAKKLDRNSIGYEINPEFISIVKDKLGINQPDMHGTEYEFLKDESTVDYEKRIAGHPYVFIDPHKLDKQTDPKKLGFGSKITGREKSDEDYYTIREIISPELIRLSSGAVVKLLGVKSKDSAIEEARVFIRNKTKGQRVYIKFDKTKYDEDNNLLAYLYLKNKTFINAHLIKHGLALPDKSMDYKYKQKFMELSNLNCRALEMQ
ncbi:MAG: DNA methyltransferase [Candidatus Kapaibacterium sp.]